MRYFATIFSSFVLLAGVAVAQSADATDRNDVIRNFIQKNYRPLDPSNQEHAAIMGWHEAITSGNYTEWLKYATKAITDADQVTEDIFRKIRAATPHRIYIEHKPTYTNPNGSHSWGLTGCKIPEYYDPPYSMLPLPDHPVWLTKMVTPYQDGTRWVILEGIAHSLFLQADTAPCNDVDLFKNEPK